MQYTSFPPPYKRVNYPEGAESCKVICHDPIEPNEEKREVEESFQNDKVNIVPQLTWFSSLERTEVLWKWTKLLRNFSENGKERKIVYVNHRIRKINKN